MLLSFIAALSLALIVCSFLFICLFPSLAAKPFAFDDIIIETIARSGLDKAAELSLFWCLLAVGVFCMLLVLLLCYFLHKEDDKAVAAPARSLPIYALIPVLPFVTYVSLYGVCNLLYLLGMLYALLLFVAKRKFHFDTDAALLLPVLIYYSTVSLLTIVVFFTGRPHISSSRPLYLITALLSLAILTIGRKHCKKAVLAAQCLIPFVLVIYFVDAYLYQGEMIRVRFAPFYYGFFGLLLAALTAFALRHAIVRWNDVTDLSYSELVNVTTAAAIFIYHSFSAAPLYAQPDQHHHGEQMIPWQQIVGLGRSAYEEYTPVSGLFPMVNGLIQNVLMRGTVSDYSPAISITMVIFCLITIVLIYLHTDGRTALLFAVFFALPSYNRQYMVLPALLLLFLPRLQEKTALWLVTWIYTCFLAGLYYPLYGAAVLVGTLPLGFSILNRLRHQMDWSEAHKKTLPLTRFALCLLPILLCLPLLSRMAAHTLTYSAQTLAADGISLLSQQPPDYFLPYLAASHARLRQHLYLTYRFLLPMLGVWLFALLLMLTWKKQKRLRFALLAGGLTLCVSYTYTLVRADTGMILSRTAPILISVCGIFLPVMLLSERKRGTLAGMDSRVLLLVLGLCFSLPTMLYQKTAHTKFPDMWIYPDGEAGLVMDDAAKLYHHYEVPELLVKMDSIDLHDKSMLGNGFMVRDQIGYLQQYESVMEKCEAAMKAHAVSADFTPDLSYMGMDGQGFYYYLNAKACSTGFIQAGKGYQAQQAILARVREERPVVFLIEPQSSYYVYVWLMEHDYVYSFGDGAFYPLELYCLVYGEAYSKASLNGWAQDTADAPNEQDGVHAPSSGEPGTAKTGDGITGSLGNPALLANGMRLGDDWRDEILPTELGLVPYSFGASWGTLRPLFENEKKLQMFSNKEPIAGIDYDFLRMTWNEDGARALAGDCGRADGSPEALTLSLSFTCDGKDYAGACVTCRIAGNALLIPMGMNPCWLLSENEHLTVTISETGADGQDGQLLLTMPLDEFAESYLTDVTFYKLSQER